MGKSLRGGIIVGVAVLAAAIVYSSLYFQRGLIRFDADGLSIILILVWALVVAVLLVVLWQRILVREEYLRKFYLSDDALFNFEQGMVPLDQALDTPDADALVAYVRARIPELTYDNAPLPVPDGFDPQYCISTHRFSQGNSGLEWTGALQRIQRQGGHRSFADVASFNSEEELRAALNAEGVLSDKAACTE